MKHYHLYGFMGETCYRLPVLERKDKVLWSEEMPSDTRASVYPGAGSFILNVNINSSDFTKYITNQDYCDQILTWAKETKADKIVDLRDLFKVEVDYMLYTNRNELVYEGTTVQTLAAKEVLIPEDVNPESNMLTYRKGIRFEKSIPFEKACPSGYGIMRGVSKEVYYFLVKAIRIKGVSDEGFVDRKPEFLTSVVDLSGRRRYAPTVSTENAILIFDSDEYDISFPPEMISFRPKKLTLELNVVMNAFCEFGNEDELLAIIHENSGSASSETGDPRFPCHPNIHPHPGMYIPHPTRPIHPLRPPFPLVPPVPPKEDDPGENPENPDDPNTPGGDEPNTPGDNTGNENEGGNPENPDGGNTETPGTGDNTGNENEGNGSTDPENPGGNTGDVTGGTTENPPTETGSENTGDNNKTPEEGDKTETPETGDKTSENVDPSDSEDHTTETP